MKNIKTIIEQLVKRSAEEEWFEFKVDWFNAKDLGEYISALSNVAVLKQKECAYFIWGIDNNTHEVVGTEVDYHKEIKGEPLQHYLARQTFRYGIGE